MIFRYSTDEAFMARRCKKCKGAMQPSIHEVILADNDMYVIGWNCNYCDLKELKKHLKDQKS